MGMGNSYGKHVSINTGGFGGKDGKEVEFLDRKK
jgi:hypothetical protein